MRIGVVIPTYDQFGEAEIFHRIVKTVEELGFDSAWFGDHIVMPTQVPDYLDPLWFEALTCAIHGLGMTSRLKFGTDVLVAPYRNPLTLAKMAATASILSSGRLILGIGIGWLEKEFDALGSPPFRARARVTDEYLKVMRLLFESSGPVEFHGEWVDFADIRFEPRPTSALPIIVGGNHAKGIERAALLGDGWHPLFAREDDYARGRAKIERIRKEHDITRDFVFSYSCAHTRLVPDGIAPAGDYSVKKNEGSSYAPPYACAPDGRPRFTGTATQLREDCRIFADAGVEQLVVRFAVTRDKNVNAADYMDQLQRFSDEIIPYCASY